MSEENILAPLLARRSVREFQNQPIPESVLRNCLRGAMAAPSARGSDPWRFFVVQDRPSLAILADALPSGAFMRDAGALVIVGGDLEHANWHHLSYLIQDCSAAMENLLLSASLLGLGGCWIGLHPREERMTAVSRCCCLPEDFIPIGAAVLGYPARPEAVPAPRTRFREEFCQWNTIARKACE